MAKLVVDEDSLSSILSSSLSSLQKLSSRKHKEFRAEAEAAAKRLSDEEAAISAGTLRVKDEARADAYYLPLYLALESGVVKMQATALDTTARLFAGGHLVGLGKASATSYPSKPTTSLNADGRLLINVIVDGCLEAAQVKEAPVQLGVIRALLTGLSSVQSPIHDQALVVSVIALYTTYLAPADETCRVTAKAALTQIHQLVFARMEHFGLQLRLPGGHLHRIRHPPAKAEEWSDRRWRSPRPPRLWLSRSGRRSPVRLGCRVDRLSACQGAQRPLLRVPLARRPLLRSDEGARVLPALQALQPRRQGPADEGQHAAQGRGAEGAAELREGRLHPPALPAATGLQGAASTRRGHCHGQ